MTNNLPPDLAAFVDQKLATGKFASADDVVVACVRDAYQREREEAELQRLLQEGLDDLEKGNVIELDGPDGINRFFDEKMDALRAKFGSQQSAG